MSYGQHSVCIKYLQHKISQRMCFVLHVCCAVPKRRVGAQVAKSVGYKVVKDILQEICRKDVVKRFRI